MSDDERDKLVRAYRATSPMIRQLERALVYAGIANEAQADVFGWALAAQAAGGSSALK